MRAPRLSVAIALASVLSMVGRSAGAQTLPSIDATTWRPPLDPAGGLVLEPVVTPGNWQWNVGAWFDYAQAPVVLRDASSGAVVYDPVAHALGMNLVANVGLGTRASIGVDVPVFLWQDGTSGLPPAIASTRSVPTTGMGDIALLGKATLVSNDHGGNIGGFGLGLLGGLTLPTGDGESFHGAGATTASLRLLGEYALGPGAVRASVGYTLRTQQQTWPDPSIGGVTFGDSIPWSLGFTLRPKAVAPSLDDGDRQSWELALHGWLPAGPAAPFVDANAPALSPAMLGLSDRIQLGHNRDAYVLAGVDFGLDQAVGVPSFRGILALGWAPRAHDRDGDGIPDERDECPDLPEDKDGIQDDDGCPEDDADGDGILDDQDACPLVPGVWWNDPKKNGCPAPDTDGDGVPDPVDACPSVKGPHSDDPKMNGCPSVTQDRDNDGIPDDADQCPDQPEDKDGNEDFDGCPDPDDDNDGIPDQEDACPKEKGEPSRDPARNGCPNPDRDGDSYDNDVDQCPDQAEVFNGVKDDDGCPDQGGAPLVLVAQKKDGWTMQPARALVLVAAPPPEQPPVCALGGQLDCDVVDPKSDMTLRAIALELNRHPDWTLGVGVRPGAGKPEEAQQSSLERAMAVANRVATLTHRRGSVDAVGWDAVKQQPGAWSGVGLVVLVAAQEAQAPNGPPAAKGGPTPAASPAAPGKK